MPSPTTPQFRGHQAKLLDVTPRPNPLGNFGNSSKGNPHPCPIVISGVGPALVALELPGESNEQPGLSRAENTILSVIPGPAAPALPGTLLGKQTAPWDPGPMHQTLGGVSRILTPIHV